MLNYLLNKKNHLKKILKEFLIKQNFIPNWISIFINPYLFARWGLYKNIKKLSSTLSGELVDIGCGQKPYQSLFTVTNYVGIEIDSFTTRRMNLADMFYDGKTFPIKNNSVDSVLSNQVLEHVFEPSHFIKEINRILKIKGKLLLTVPFIWDEHEQPYDYARYTSFGLKYLLEQNGFKILHQEKSISDLRMFIQLIIGWIHKIIVTRYTLINYLTTIILIAPFNILGILLTPLFPNNKDFYLDNVILAEKIK
jgi:SAM-dependent methyltransferase